MPPFHSPSPAPKKSRLCATGPASAPSPPPSQKLDRLTTKVTKGHKARMIWCLENQAVQLAFIRASHGYLCPKGVALKDLHEDPDRLRTPLVRRDGRLVEATWEEAFAEIERRLPPIIEQHGRNSVALVLGNPTVHKTGLLLYAPRLI